MLPDDWSVDIRDADEALARSAREDLSRLEAVGIRRSGRGMKPLAGGGCRPPTRAGPTDGTGTHQASGWVGRLVPGTGSALAPLVANRERSERVRRLTAVS